MNTKSNSTALCLVADFKYLEKIFKTVNQIRTIGKFNGDIIIITDVFSFHFN